MLNSPLEDVKYNALADVPLKCTNPKCITNQELYLEQKFSKVKSDPNIHYCVYCEKQYK